MINTSRRAFMAKTDSVIEALKFTLTNDSQAGTISFNIPNGLTEQQLKEIEISTNGKNWTKYENHGTGLTITSPTLLAGESVYFRGVGLQTANSNTVFSNFSSSQNVKFVCKGKVSYLIKNDNVVDYGFYGLFFSCKGIVTAPELPATTLANSCYYVMFGNCINLTTAPELPATTLASFCYSNMFYGCTSLVNAPELPATTLANSCYYEMFYGGCTSLVNAPALPATTLADSCYYSMFYNCTSLTTAPSLPATTLANSCYNSMFNGCTSLITAPNLPATTLAVNCYRLMFKGCTSLTTTPVLPATILANHCYRLMFNGCTSLTTAPDLPAPRLANSCYYNMFSGCTSLNKITMLATNISASDCLYGWVQGVAATGTFIKDPTMTTLPTGDSGIPSGWIVKDLPNPYLDYSSPNTFSITSVNRTKWWEGDLEYSYNKTDWQLWTGLSLTAVQGDDNLYHIYMRGKCTKLGGLFQNYAPVFSGEYKTVSANGDIRTLMNYEDVDAVVLTSQCLAYYFYNNQHLIKAPDIPFTTTASECFSNMFHGCVNLQESPILPALTLTSFCYVRMFEGCTNLQKITMLATDISANGCLSYWVTSVGSNGTFIKNAAMTTLPTGENGIPSGWTVQDYPV